MNSTHNNNNNNNNSGDSSVMINMTNIKNNIIYATLKPFKVFGFTLIRWWPPKLCILLCFILYIVLAAGFRITANQSIFEFDNNIEDRSIVWYFISLFSSTFIAFYCHEWIIYDEEQSERDNYGKIISLENMTKSKERDHTNIDMNVLDKNNVSNNNNTIITNVDF